MDFRGAQEQTKDEQTVRASQHIWRRHSVSGAQFAFSIYDFEGKDEVDAFYLGDVLRALNLNPTLQMVEKLGGQKIKSKSIRSYWPCTQRNFTDLPICRFIFRSVIAGSVFDEIMPT